MKKQQTVELVLEDESVSITIHKYDRYEAIVLYDDILERAKRDGNFQLEIDLDDFVVEA